MIEDTGENETAVQPEAAEPDSNKAEFPEEVPAEALAAQAGGRLTLERLYTADGTPLDDETQRRIELGLMLYEAYGDSGKGKKKGKKKGGGKA